jgi:hypothetical protein
MPARLSFHRNSNLKRLKLSVVLLFFPLFFFGQSLTGLWTGALSNDSTTVRKDQLFEIALTEYRGKVYGYSRSEFIVNDTLYYIVKRVKGTINGDVCEVVDDDIIAYNFRGKLDKGIKVTSTFRRNGNDSAWYLAGTWKTNATKKYYSVTGKVDLGQEKDLTASKIFPHLEELKKADEVAFYKERNETAPVVKIAKPQRIKTEYSFSADPVDPIAIAAPDLQRAETELVAPDLKKSNEELTRTKTKEIAPGPSIAVNAPDLKRAETELVAPDIKRSGDELTRTKTKEISAGPSVTINAPDLKRAETELVAPDVKKPGDELARTETKTIDASVSLKPTASSKTVAINKPVVQDKPTTTNPQPEKKQTASTPIAKNTAKPNNTAATELKQPANNAVVKTNTSPVNNSSKVSTLPANTEVKKTETSAITQNPKPVITEPKKTVEELTKNVTTIAGRKSEFSQEVYFTADSLQLALYDNGEIDGDTVSVIMNGETIMARQGLKASAIRKTIYIKPGSEEDFTLVLFADNLGKYPPNTGLLVVYDGEEIYHLRFSSDFQKSSGIVFRRKK